MKNIKSTVNETVTVPSETGQKRCCKLESP